MYIPEDILEALNLKPKMDNNPPAGTVIEFQLKFNPLTDSEKKELVDSFSKIGITAKM